MKKRENKNKIANTILSYVFIWVEIVIVAISIANNFSPFEKTKEISYTEYQNLLNQDLIESAEITGRTFKGKLKVPQSFSDNIEDSETFLSVSTVLPEVSLDISSNWDEKGIKYEFKDVTMSAFDYLLQFSPWLLIIIFWFFIMRRMQMGGQSGGIFNFGGIQTPAYHPLLLTNEIHHPHYPRYYIRTYGCFGREEDSRDCC